MQELNAFLDSAAAPAGGIQQQQQPGEAVDLRFFVQDAQDALREVSLQWRPPTGSSRFSDRPAERWARSADRCVATLLARIEQTEVEPADDGRDVDDGARRARVASGRPISDILKPDAA
eukprot:820872-Prymnesium_polylepis.1